MVASFALSLAERPLLLNTWVLPVLLLTAGAYRATEQEERSLKVVFNIARGFDSWGTALSQASLHPDDGGFSLPPPPPTPGSRYRRDWPFQHLFKISQSCRALYNQNFKHGLPNLEFHGTRGLYLFCSLVRSLIPQWDSWPNP